MPSKAPSDYGGGLKVSRTHVDVHPAGPPRHGEFGQAERAFTLASTFFSGVLAITASQFLGAPLKLIDPQFYDAYMAYTKESFAVLITSLTQWWAPTVVRVSGDDTMNGQFIQMKDGSLKCNFSERLVLMANHQLYTDWLYIWWIAYTNSMHGRIYIILKESIKNIPILGWGAQFYNFIFLSRKWETDKPRFQQALSHLSKPGNPMWLLIFPEGTNLSASTRARSKAWADKNGLQDMKHQLLPRSTGIRFSLQELKKSTDWLYDCTIGYEGVPPGEFGQDIFTLRSSFLEGRPPKSVNMHWRRFKISDIPVDNPKAFDVWLRNRWREKDYMLEHFNRHARFPADDYWKSQLADRSDASSSVSSIRSVPRPAYYIETEVKSGKFEEFLRIFAPITGLAMALFLAYGATPDELPFPNGQEFLQRQLGSLLGTGMVPKSLGDFDRLVEAGPPVPPTGPEIPALGNTPEDKRKQEKYLRLFKESLPPDIVKDAQRRLKDAQASSSNIKCQKSSTSLGKKNGKTNQVKSIQNKPGLKVTGLSTPTKSNINAVKKNPSQTYLNDLEKQRLPKKPVNSSTPTVSSSAPKRPSAVRSATPKMVPVGTMNTKRTTASATKPLTTPRTAMVNGVKIPITSNKIPATSIPTNEKKPNQQKIALINGVQVRVGEKGASPQRRTPSSALSKPNGLGQKVQPTKKEAVVSTPAKKTGPLPLTESNIKKSNMINATRHPT